MAAAPARCPHDLAFAALADRPPGTRARCPCGTWVDAPARVQVFRAPLEPPPAAAPPTRRARPAEARERDHVRELLCALRPDYTEPLRPLPKLTAVPAVRVRDPQAGWGDVPTGLTDTGEVRALPPDHGADARARAAEVLDLVAALPPDARAVATWLRERADLWQGLRGLYFDVGEAFADAAQAASWGASLTAKRDGAAHHGRRLVLATARAWGLPPP